MDETKRHERLKRLRRSTECPIEGCGKRIPRTMLMCGAHWHEVPTPLKRDVRVSARRMWNDLTAEDGYRAWLDDAVAAIAAVEEP